MHATPLTRFIPPHFCVRSRGSAFRQAAMKAAILLLSVVFLECWSFAARIRNPARRKVHWVMRMYNITGCPGQGDPSRVLNYTVRMDRHGEEYVDASVLFTKPCKRISKAVLTAQRCGDHVSANTCEHYGRIEWKAALCQLAEAPGMPWSSLYESISPTPKCPFRKGIYTVSNYTIDVNMFARLGENLLGYVWHAEANVYNEDNDMFLCFTLLWEAKPSSRRP